MPPARRVSDHMPLRVSARVKARQGVPTQLEPMPVDSSVVDPCSVCFEELATKRSLAFLPCSHKFHRTCAITWLETRESRRGHVCPLCRTRVDKIKANNRVAGNLYLAFGQAQPEPLYITQVMRDLREKRMDCVILWLKNRNSKEAACVRAQRKAAMKQKRPDEYITDIDDELKKLKDRMKVYNTVHKIYRDGYRSAWNLTLERIRNGEELVDYDSDTFSDIFPDEEEGDEELEIFREAINQHDTYESEMNNPHNRQTVSTALQQGEQMRRERSDGPLYDETEVYSQYEEVREEGDGVEDEQMDYYGIPMPMETIRRVVSHTNRDNVVPRAAPAAAADEARSDASSAATSPVGGARRGAASTTAARVTTRPVRKRAAAGRNAARQ